MKHFLTALALMLTTTSAFAGFTGSVTATNDYIWRSMGQGADMAPSSQDIDYCSKSYWSWYC